MSSTPLSRTALACALALCLLAGDAESTAPATPESQICDLAAAQAARESGVPLPVLLAITRTETARRGAPWPWTVNMEGAGHWFDTRAQAEAYAEGQYLAGARSFDVGCFQINHRWHGQHFLSIRAMFEPADNARYAARFLTELYTELGSWDDAVGAYHSRTERHAARYLRIYHGHLAELGVAPDMPPPAPEAPRVNGFPLLQAGGTRALGSLVPQDDGPVRPLFEARP